MRGLQGISGRRWCWPSSGCAQCPDGFVVSVTGHVPAPNRAGISLTGRFWAKQKEVAVSHTAAALSGQLWSSGEGNM